MKRRKKLTKCFYNELSVCRSLSKKTKNYKCFKIMEKHPSIFGDLKNKKSFLKLEKCLSIIASAIGKIYKCFVVKKVFVDLITLPNARNFAL